MSDREKSGLRGPVKSCTEETRYPARTDVEGTTYPEVHWIHATEYDMDGRMVGTRSGGSDDSDWVTRNIYNASGRLLRTTSGKEGEKAAETLFSYDDNGKVVKITRSGAPENPIVFHYDDNGRKTVVQVSRPEDYRPRTASAGSPFEIADRPPNLPGGGTATTIYDEHDRATEVEVRDDKGEIVSRAVRVYDAQGHIVEEKQILDNLETMFPPEARVKMLEESGLSPDQLRQELHAQLTKLMGGQPEPYSVSYGYDTHGRVNHTCRRIYNHEDEIEAIYDEHGDIASEITRSARMAEETDPSKPAPGPPDYSEVSYSYKYDDHENWVEKTMSYRSSPDGEFQSSTAIKRTLTYY
ncbi:MAG: hypothetical protein LAO24_11655 [Acidobacteriia bacterium]|nr:hypothetical protein [Terriglobia bacterium]